MGNLDDNNYVVEVKLLDSATDKRYDIVREIKPNVKQFQLFFDKNGGSLRYSSLAEKILRFFVEYDNGAYLPDKYNSFEPVNKQFDFKDISRPVSCLATAGGELYLKKSRCYSAVITNEDYSVIWEDGVYLDSQRALPKYLTTIRCFFPVRKNTDLTSIIQFMHGIKEFFQSDNGKVYLQRTKEILAR